LGEVKPENEGRVIRAQFGTLSPVGEAPKTVSDAIFEAFFGVVEREGLASVRKRIGLSATTAERWAKGWREGAELGLSRANLETLCQMPEVRAAAAAALLSRPESDATAWEAIAGELSGLMDPSTGWELVRKLRAMSEVGLLDGGLSALDGMVTARRRAQAEQEKSGSRAPQTQQTRKTT